MVAPIPSIVTVGTYDGVHLGHRYLLSTTRDEAARAGFQSVVVTFDPHPRTVVRPSEAPLLLTTTPRKLELLEQTGIDRIVTFRFDRAAATEPAASFVERVLVTELGARGVIVGENFRFGHDREGDIATLITLGSKFGFTAQGLALLTDEHGAPISAGHIRELIARGELGEASRMLGRPHELRGAVRSATDGRIEIGVPPGFATPPSGRYQLTAVLADGDQLPTTGTVRIDDDSRNVVVELEALPRAVPLGAALVVLFESAEAFAARERAN